MKEDLSEIARIIELERELKRHDEAYYGADSPTISDTEYDGLCAELERLYKANPEYEQQSEYASTPAHAEFGDQRRVIRHSRPMLSLDKAHTTAELFAWDDRNHRELGISELREEMYRITYKWVLDRPAEDDVYLHTNMGDTVIKAGKDEARLVIIACWASERWHQARNLVVQLLTEDAGVWGGDNKMKDYTDIISIEDLNRQHRRED